MSDVDDARQRYRTGFAKRVAFMERLLSPLPLDETPTPSVDDEQADRGDTK